MEKQFAPLHTRAESYEIGKALRHEMPRRSNGEWRSGKDRLDPVTILEQQGKSRIQNLLPIRYARMRVSPLAFLRGAAAVMASDLGETPAAGLRVQSCGDCHLANFGSYATPEAIPVFDINDFDETAPAPFEWDLKRLSTSLVLAGREAGLRARECRELASVMAQSYAKEIEGLAQLTPFQAWNSRIDLLKIIGDMAGHRARDKLRARLSRQLDSISHQFGMIEPGKMPHLRERPPLVQRLPEHDDAVREAFKHYVDQLPPERRIILQRYRLQDVIFKVVGVGSVGRFCALGLYSTADGEPVILQIKEAQASVLEAYAGKVHTTNHGERVVTGQRIMQAASDAFLGWTRSMHSVSSHRLYDPSNAGHHFYVRQTKDTRLAAIGEQIENEILPFYAALCGKTLGRAHARSANLPMLAGYLGRGRGFSDAIASFGVLYADQTERDWKHFNDAITEGRLKAA
ncbi:DUF2252 domain-containing protein [Kozakia baliensis]|uniref:DUF2252 domain-containing protein n=1 Tax=Kozakia baliensis TaxID=153496 RepID=UPI0004951C57|nr:DUF2252 domain-containing protein [Kozakia baliensis]